MHSDEVDISPGVRLQANLMAAHEPQNYYLPAFVVSIREKLSSRHQAVIAAILLTAMIVAYYILLVPATAGDGTKPVFVTCNEVISWKANATCGINAQDCNPLESSWTSYRCPSSCLNSGSALTPIGSGPYRGDSGICLAAIHSGVISTNTGGCFYLRRSGWHDYFAHSSRNTITSAAYRAPYPLTYELMEDPSARLCYDFSFSVILPLMFATIVILAILKVAEVYLWVTLVCSAALYTAGPISAFLSAYDVAINLQTHCIAFGGFIWLLWDHGGRVHFHGVSDKPFQLVAFYIIPFFVVLHLDYARAINRDFDLTLSSSFLNGASPVTVLFAAGVVLIMLLFAIYLIYHLFKSHALKPVVLQYAKFLLPISVLAVSVGVATAGSFHLHHYILPLLVWGLVAALDKPTSQSMLIQSVILALFVNGVIQWGMDPLFDIVSDVGDFGSWQPTLTFNVTPNKTSNYTDLSVYWLKDAQYNTTVVYSLQLNMIEAYRGADTNVTLRNVPTNARYQHEICVGQVWFGDQLPCIGQVRFQFTNSSSVSLLS